MSRGFSQAMMICHQILSLSQELEQLVKKEEFNNMNEIIDKKGKHLNAVKSIKSRANFTPEETKELQKIENQIRNIDEKVKNILTKKREESLKELEKIKEAEKIANAYEGTVDNSGNLVDVSEE